MSKGYRHSGPQWLIRAGMAMERLEKTLKHGELMLPDIAEAVITTNQLLSDLSTGYDEFYEESARRGLVDRRPQNPIAAPLSDEEGEKDGMEPGPPDSDR